jgi:hypothetical protein
MLFMDKASWGRRGERNVKIVALPAGDLRVFGGVAPALLIPACSHA